MTRRVHVIPLDIEPLRAVLGPERHAALRAAAVAAREALAGRVVLHVNSTATGGGVAEMLPTLLGYSRGAGIDARWSVIDGTAEFFAVTKLLHNLIHGDRGSVDAMGPSERSSYEQVLARAAGDLVAELRAGDIAVLHDPQALGLAPALHRMGIRTVWRCHIGLDSINTATEEAWQFLEPYFSGVDRFVFSRAAYKPPNVPLSRVRIITPSLDPLSPKNRHMTESEIIAVLGYTGLLSGTGRETPGFLRRDGTPARMQRRADITQLGPAVPVDEPLVVQVSRWDRLKDMGGVMLGFADDVAAQRSAHLILAGPNVTGVTDDPEGAAELERCIHLWRELPHVLRQRIHLACLPVADVDENAVIVNALQRHASVVVQKSLAEGFGLTVLEAMWKGRPVVATKVGGIRDQIPDDGCGLLLADPADLAGFGLLVRQLLDDPQLAENIGNNAAERAAYFLPDKHLQDWGRLLTELVAPQQSSDQLPDGGGT
jgi:trehalose synthase